MNKVDLVIIPPPSLSHLGSTAEFAKLLLERDDRFRITVLVMKPPQGGSDPGNQPFFRCYPQIRFVELPPLESPPSTDLLIKSVEKFVSDFVESHRDLAKEAIVNRVLPNCERFAGIVIDMFCTSMIDVARELGVPSYLYFTSGAGSLGFVLHLATRQDQGGAEFEISDPESVIPSYTNPVPANVLPEFAFNKEGGFAAFANHARRFKETKGILINTFMELEPHAVRSLSVYEDLPDVYTVGPQILHQAHNPWQSNENQHREILKWLDLQPPCSVVFLCFGSWGSFSESELKEIAIALEQSGYRFLWSIRAIGNDRRRSRDDKINYAEMLPEGFLERTGDRGFVCGWTPQIEVLAHPSVGCFVSHCGWNSILESLWHGVPIVTWPLYAEQKLNAFQIARDLGLATELKLDSSRSSRDAVVKSGEIARAVTCLMEEDGALRKTLKNVSQKSREAVAEGGSSFSSVGRFIQALAEGSSRT